MSIWSSIPGLDFTIEDRDNYTGKPTDPQDDRNRWQFGVATATPWHGLIRFSMDNEAQGPSRHISAEALIDVTEANALIAALQRAVRKCFDDT